MIICNIKYKNAKSLTLLSLRGKRYMVPCQMETDALFKVFAFKTICIITKVVGYIITYNLYISKMISPNHSTLCQSYKNLVWSHSKIMSHFLHSPPCIPKKLSTTQMLRHHKITKQNQLRQSCKYRHANRKHPIDNLSFLSFYFVLWFCLCPYVGQISLQFIYAMLLLFANNEADNVCWTISK